MAHVIFKNLAATGAGHVVHVINSIVLLPVFLATWGVSRYGEWLVLIALPTYFSVVGDIGLTQVTGNDMTIKFAQNRRNELVKVFQSTWLLVSLLSGLVVCLIAITVMSKSVIPWIAGLVIPEKEASLIVLCMLMVYFLSVQLGMMQSALRAVGRYAEGTISYNAIGLLESMATIFFLLLGAGPIKIAIVMVAGRLFAVATCFILLRRFASWIRHGFTEVSTSEMRRLLPPSVAILGIPAGNAAMIQGAILVLNHTIGPGPMVLFSTTRTLTRFILQFTSLFSNASWPEISRLYGAGRTEQLSAFLTHGTQLVAIITISFSVIIIAGAPLIFAIWTVGKIDADRTLVVILMIGAMATAFRAFPDTLIVATNRHISYSLIFLAICTASVVLCYFMSTEFYLLGAAGVITASELVLLFISFSIAIAQIGKGAEPLRNVFATRLPIARFFNALKRT
jgi:O-antigen/teichoic acid export membrane protein